MKAPINPSEPLFPIRYNEPVCQYYMKHGTCKFGQACKFHHPPEVAGKGTSIAINGNNSVLIGVPGGGRKDDGGSNSSQMWRSGSDAGAQMLPQRPDEPNCIFFLKNGRCKYGATCRYHHPLNASRNRNTFEDGRNNGANSRQQPDHRSAPKVHYVTALPPGSMQQGHFVVADGTVTFLSLDGNTPAHVVSIVGKDFTSPGTGTIASSTSSTSIASSFEASISNNDNLDISSGSLWNNRKSSGNPSNGYNLPGSVSTGNMQSDGAGNHSYESNTGPSTWRGHRSSSFDHTRTRSSSLSTQEDEMRRSASVHSALDKRIAGRPRSSSMASAMSYGGNRNPNPRDNVHGNATGAVPRARLHPGEDDDGLSMMASALLTMIDTPADKAATQQQDQYHEINERRGVGSSRLDNQFYGRHHALNRAIVGPPEDLSRGYRPSDDPSRGYHSTHHSTPSSYYEETQPQFLGQNNATADYQASDLSIPRPTAMNEPLNLFGGQTERQARMQQASRIQTWQGSATAGVIHENAQFSSINPSQPLPSNSSEPSTNIGLYY